MAERTLSGFAAAPGLAAGPVVRLEPARQGEAETIPVEARQAEWVRARKALEDTAGQLEQLAEEMRRTGRPEEGEIIETGALMARDPGLEAAVSRLVLTAGRSAPAALCEAADAVAEELEALPDPVLAERADDVRSLGRRAAAAASGTSRRLAGAVLVAASLGPADVAELGPDVRQRD